MGADKNERRRHQSRLVSPIAARDYPDCLRRTGNIICEPRSGIRVHLCNNTFAPDNVFGSRARGDAGPDSDIDLAVVLDG